VDRLLWFGDVPAPIGVVDLAAGATVADRRMTASSTGTDTSERFFADGKIELSRGRPWATDVDRRLADQMSSYWVNFAASGDPNGKGRSKWAPYDQSAEPYQELGDTIQTKHHLLKAQLGFMESLQQRRPPSP
jgi:Carboxylesterase family